LMSFAAIKTMSNRIVCRIQGTNAREVRSSRPKRTSSNDFSLID
jgi:hypothetical protein